MEQDQKKLYKDLARYSAIGLEMGFCVAIGLGIGYYLDRFFNTKPWLMVIFFLIGVVAAFRSLFKLMKDLDQKEPRK